MKRQMMTEKKKWWQNSVSHEIQISLDGKAFKKKEKRMDKRLKGEKSQIRWGLLLHHHFPESQSRGRQKERESANHLLSRSLLTSRSLFLEGADLSVGSERQRDNITHSWNTFPSRHLWCLPLNLVSFEGRRAQLTPHSDVRFLCLPSTLFL